MLSASAPWPIFLRLLFTPLLVVHLVHGDEYVVHVHNGTLAPLPVHYVYVTLTAPHASLPDAPPQLSARVASRRTGERCVGALDALLVAKGQHQHWPANGYQYVVRFRPAQCCLAPSLWLYHNDDVVGDRNGYHLGDSIVPEECERAAPIPTISNWIASMQCPSKHGELIESDMKYWIDAGGINMSSALGSARRLWPDESKSHAWCHYRIVDNEIFRRCYGVYADFKQFVDALLLSLKRKLRFPDFEFLVNLGDWPLVKTDPPVPMISWCGSSDTFDIVAPTYEMTESVLEMLRRVTLDVFTALNYGATSPAYANKVDKVFFRGRDSNRRRLDLVNMAKALPASIDAGITRYFFFGHEAHEYGPAAGHTQFRQFFNYRYQLNMDGTVAAYRLAFLLAGNCTVFKQNSVYYEHYYRLLVPGVHFVPVEEDLSDLAHTLQLARSNPDKAQHIAMAGAKFVLENLTPRHVLCYYAQLFEKYSELLSELVYKPMNNESFHSVADNSLPKSHNRCTCSSVDSALHSNSESTHSHNDEL